MTATVKDIIRIMDVLAPPGLAEPWDNSGLQIGRYNQPVKSVWVALDPSVQVIEAACRNDVDLLITHHPLFFKPIKSLDINTPTGKIIRQALLHEISIFSAHTNLDVVSEGINDALAVRIGLQHVCALCHDNESEGLTMPAGDNYGLGRIGDLECDMNLRQFAVRVKGRMGLGTVKVVGRNDLMVHRVAVCCGSGSSLLGLFFASDAQVFVSGDLKYHDARDAEAVDRALIDIGHFASESLFPGILADRLRREFISQQLDVAVHHYKMENDPFQIY